MFDQEFESEWEYEADDFDGELEGEVPEESEYEYEYETLDDTEGPFDEAEEMELAADLLSVSDDAELEQFLGKLFKRVRRGVSRIAKSPIGRAVARVAKPFVRRAISSVRGAAGRYLRGRGSAGAYAANAFGLELEGLSPEDQEFEVARRVVRMVGTAAQKAATAPSSASPTAVAKAAMTDAARKHAPGLVAGTSTAAGGRRHSGRWVRRGRRIVLMGV